MKRFAVFVLLAVFFSFPAGAQECKNPVPSGWACTQKFCWAEKYQEEILSELKAASKEAFEVVKKYMSLPRYTCADRVERKEEMNLLPLNNSLFRTKKKEEIPWCPVPPPELVFVS